MTGFKCPKCGQTEEFFASSVVLTTTTHITEDGWDYLYDKYADVELADGAAIMCCKCNYEADAKVFEED